MKDERTVRTMREMRISKAVMLLLRDSPGYELKTASTTKTSSEVRSTPAYSGILGIRLCCNQSQLESANDTKQKGVNFTTHRLNAIAVPSSSARSVKMIPA